MNAENNNAASAIAGSGANGPDSQALSGQPQVNGQGAQPGYDYEAGYRELEGKMGKMGEEVGEYRSFFNNMSPLLEKLDKSPELVQAIIDGKIDQQLAQAVASGRVNITDAQAVTQANQEVQSELGAKAYEAMSSDKIESMIEAKTKILRSEFEEKADLKDFEASTQKFIEATPDFVEHADAIDKWLDKHDGVTDIEIAYWAVRGKSSDTAAKKAAENSKTQLNQEAVANASGGGISAQATLDGVSIIDQLVGGSRNPDFF